MRQMTAGSSQRFTGFESISIKQRVCQPYASADKGHRVRLQSVVRSSALAPVRPAAHTQDDARC